MLGVPGAGGGGVTGSQGENLLGFAEAESDFAAARKLDPKVSDWAERIGIVEADPDTGPGKSKS